MTDFAFSDLTKVEVNLVQVKVILTHEVASVKLWIAVLLRQDLFNRAFQHTVLAAVAEALVVLAKFWGNIGLIKDICI